MPAPTPSDLLGLDWTHLGEPFVDGVSGTGATTLGLDWTHLGEPFVAVEDSGVVEAGALAEVSDEAFAGTGHVIAPGALASEDVAALAGSQLTVATGALAEVVDEALAGTGHIISLVVIAAETSAALAGTGLALTAGALAEVVDQALEGTGLHVTPGGLAGVVDEAIEGRDLWRFLPTETVNVARSLTSGVTVQRSAEEEVEIARTVSGTVDGG